MSSSRDILLTKLGCQGSMTNNRQDHITYPQGCWTKHIRSQFTTRSRRTQKYFFICKKRKKIGGCSRTCQDLLSRVTSIARAFGRMWSLDTKNVAVSLVMIWHVCSAINVYRICRNVETWYQILKHRYMSTKDVPIILRNMVTSFSPSNCSELKWTVYKRIRVCNVKPLSEGK